MDDDWYFVFDHSVLIVMWTIKVRLVGLAVYVNYQRQLNRS